MSAPERAADDCPNCNALIPPGARFCPACGTRLAGDTALDVVPVQGDASDTQWFGVAPPTALLVVSGVAFVLAVLLFVTGHWPFGLILLGVAALVLAGFMEMGRHRPHTERAPRRGSPMGERTRSAWEELRARSTAAADVRRLQSALLYVDDERRQALHELGAAAHARDSTGEAAARAKLSELDERERRLRRELDGRLEAAGERIRKAKLPVQETMLVVPAEPGPPPDEADLPEPATVPEPYPPPDEADLPEPARIPEPSPDQPRED
ncbi:MAG: zinc-ribbon domain-containing protein [Actinomycetota bacterium]